MLQVLLNNIFIYYWVLRRRARRELRHVRLPPRPQQCQFTKELYTYVVYLSSPHET